VATLFYPADPDSWKTTLCAPGGMASWIRENKKGQLAPWVSPEQAEMQDKIMKMSGWTGPLNWYAILPHYVESHIHCIPHRYKQAIAGVTARSEANVTDEQKKIKIPNLYIGAQRDVICVAPLQEAGMKPFAQDLTVKNINTGHWLMMEKPDETWALVDEFIKAKLRL
jgi:soluble epoxide hydrolase / lipid-phosphate phosphatase